MKTQIDATVRSQTHQCSSLIFGLQSEQAGMKENVQGMQKSLLHFMHQYCGFYQYCMLDSWVGQDMAMSHQLAAGRSAGFVQAIRIDSFPICQSAGYQTGRGGYDNYMEIRISLSHMTFKVLLSQVITNTLGKSRVVELR